MTDLMKNIRSLLILALTSVMALSSASHAGQTEYTYDDLRRITMIRDGEGNEIYYDYNTEGLLSRVRSGYVNGTCTADCNAAHVAYSDAGRIVRKWATAGILTTDAVLSETNYVFDPVTGRLDQTKVRATPTVDRITRNIYYDNASATPGMLHQVIQAHGSAVSRVYVEYAYDAAGRQISAIDANGNATEYKYGAWGRMKKAKYPKRERQCDTGSPCPDGTVNWPDGSHYEAFDYDRVGNLTTVRTRNGDLIFSEYDALGQLTRKIVCVNPANDNVYLNDDNVYVNDCVTEAGGTTRSDVAYDYNLMGQDTAITELDGSGSATPAVSLAYAYDTAGRLVSQMQPYGRTVDYIHAADFTWKTVKQPAASTATGSIAALEATYHFDLAGRVVQIDEAGRAIVTLTHDTLGRRTGVTYGTAGASTGYSYHANSTLYTLNQTFSAGTNDVGFTFSYNLASQITQRIVSNDLYAWAAAADESVSYVANGHNQYSSVAGKVFTYDMNGNLTSDATRAYAYDAENRLVTVDDVTAGGHDASFEYDPRGRRIAKVVDGARTEFLYDGDALVAEYDGSGNVVRQYIHGPGVDEPLFAIIQTATTELRRYLHKDHQGSIIAQSKKVNGTRSLASIYDPFGRTEVVAGDASESVPFGYTGQFEDADLGLYYYKARYYSPALGRFLQTDPIGYEDNMNLYAYVGNDPMNWTDPSGTNELEAIQRMMSVGLQKVDNYLAWCAESCVGTRYFTSSGPYGARAAAGELSERLGPFADPGFWMAVEQSNPAAVLPGEAMRYAAVSLRAYSVTRGTRAASPVAREGLRRQLTSNTIATHSMAGHADSFAKIGIKSETALARHIEGVIADPTASKALGGGRMGYLDDGSGTIVVVNPRAIDRGTAFRPNDPWGYYDNSLQ